MLICDLNNFFSKEQPKPYSDEIDNDKLKLYIEFSSTINLVFSDINTSSKIASTNKNLVSNLFNEIFIPPPEIV